ncbi:MAG TPA: site-2 protease family protein, partial [Phototrophicaceae bacterium]|nr:site-2 protease family protein [Phototrophicaceae bacterium]
MFFLSALPRELWIPGFVGLFLAVLLGMTLHEFAHNYVASLMGDPMPARWGKLTLNPMVHIYWPGFIMWLIIGFGILGTAPIDPYRIPLQNRRWGYLAAVAAGPISNLILAAILALIYRVANIQSYELRVVLLLMINLNALMFLFNLLPFSPLDGWTIVYSLLPADLADSWAQQKQTTY